MRAQAGAAGAWSAGAGGDGGLAGAAAGRAGGWGAGHGRKRRERGRGGDAGWDSIRRGTAGGAGGAVDAGAAGDAGPAPSAGPALGDPLPPCLRTVDVAAADTLMAALGAALAGDCIVVADGTYAFPAITAQGTAASPIVVRAANRGQVTVTGNVVLMGAAYVVVEGLAYVDMGSAIATNADHCRITRSRFQLGVARANGTSRYTRIDRNEFGPKNTGNGHYIHATEMSEFTQVDRNHLHDATGGGTSRDAVSLGCCGPEFDYHMTGNVMEHNLLVNCSSDAEYVSIKSSGNTIRYNTFRRNGGTMTLRVLSRFTTTDEAAYAPIGRGTRTAVRQHSGRGRRRTHRERRREQIAHTTHDDRQLALRHTRPAPQMRHRKALATPAIDQRLAGSDAVQQQQRQDNGRRQQQRHCRAHDEDQQRADNETQNRQRNQART